MKKLVMLCVALFLGTSAFATQANQPYDNKPNANPSPFIGNLIYYGASSYYVEASTAADVPVLLVAGSGYYYGTDCSSGTAGDYGMAFDSASSSGITVATKGKALSPAVFTATSNVTQYVPPGGSRRFVNGLVGIKHGSAGANCVFTALTDAAIALATH